MGAEPTTTWGISSALLAGFFVIMVLVNTRWIRQLGAWKDPSFKTWVPLFAYPLASAATVGLVLNALGIGFHRAFGPYCVFR